MRFRITKDIRNYSLLGAYFITALFISVISHISWLFSAMMIPFIIMFVYAIISGDWMAKKKELLRDEIKNESKKIKVKDIFDIDADKLPDSFISENNLNTDYIPDGSADALCRVDRKKDESKKRGYEEILADIRQKKQELEDLKIELMGVI